MNDKYKVTPNTFLKWEKFTTYVIPQIFINRNNSFILFYLILVGQILLTLIALEIFCLCTKKEVLGNKSITCQPSHINSYHDWLIEFNIPYHIKFTP